MVKQAKRPKIIIVMPAYCAEKTVTRTFDEVPHGLISEIILVDDSSNDNTVEVAKRLGISVYRHLKNKGYGGNQKTCYIQALKRNPDVVVMLHPDYQYDGSKIDQLVRPILTGEYDIMFGSRIRNRGSALRGGMPKIKYITNRLYTLFANIIYGENLSEYLSGLRAYNRRALENVPFMSFSDDFAFDQQFTAAAVASGLRIGEIPIPTRYHDDQHTLSFFSIKGIRFIFESWFIVFLYVLNKLKIYQDKIFLQK